MYIGGAWRQQLASAGELEVFSIQAELDSSQVVSDGEGAVFLDPRMRAHCVFLCVFVCVCVVCVYIGSIRLQTLSTALSRPC